MGELWTVPWLGERVTYLLTHNIIVDPAIPSTANKLSVLVLVTSQVPRSSLTSPFRVFIPPLHVVKGYTCSSSVRKSICISYAFSYGALFTHRIALKVEIDVHPFQWGLRRGLRFIRQTFIYRNLPTLMSN